MGLDKISMKTLSRIFIAFILTTISILPVLAEGYTALVLPNSSVSPKVVNRVDNTDIEKLLARKIIDKLEKTGMDYAPTLNVLRISIINNANYNSNSIEPMNNVKAIAKAYGISKVILVSSKTEILSAGQQKEFWNKMNLPVITPSESGVKVTTTVTLYNSKTDEVIYSDVFYKKLNVIGNDVSNEHKKLSAINDYYDELLPRLFDEIRDSKETHAKIISGASLQETSNTDATPVMMYKPVTREKDTTKTIKKVKPEQTVKKNISTEKKERLAERIKNGLKTRTPKQAKVKVVKETEQKTKPYVVRKNVLKKLSKENGMNKTAKEVKVEPKKKISANNIIKAKYNNMKEKYITDKAVKAQKNENNVQYSTVISPNEENTSCANKYIQTRPRANAKSYTTHFDNEVNDI